MTALIVRRDRIEPGAPVDPPPGPVDVGLGLLAARTAGPTRAEVRAALLAYFTTPDPHPMRTAAAVAGLTEAEVRTWVGQLARLAAQVGPPPALIDALAQLGSAPRPAEEASAALATAGLTSQPMNPASLLRLAAVYRLTSLPTVVGGRREWVVPPDTATRLRRWRRHASTRVAVLGLAPLAALPLPPPDLPDELAHAMLGDPHKVRLHHGWVWRTDSRGRIPRLARIMLLAGPQSAATIAAGLDDVRTVTPPIDVLDAWLDTVPWARRTTTGRFTARTRDDSVLGRWDRAILDHARAGRPLTTTDLAAVLRLDRNHLGATLRRSVLLNHVSYGHWSLRRAH